MTPVLILLPFAVGIWNRYARGEGNVPRWAWYGSMTALAAALANHAYRLSLAQFFQLDCIWLLFIIGYAMAPWSPMFAAATGQEPRFISTPHWRWMDGLAALLKQRTGRFESWYTYGVLFGTIRAGLMLPGIIALCLYYRSAVPLVGLVLLSMGLVYYAAGVVVRHLRKSMEVSDSVAIVLAEFSMGYLIGWFMILCGGIRGGV